MMAQVLYLTAQNVMLYHTSRKGARALMSFTCDESGYAALVRSLKNSRPQPIAILADLIEEEFREENLPHTLGRDRRNLHARHAGKLFRTTPFRHYQVVARRSGGRRDDCVLFSALTHREHIEPLMKALSEAAIPVKGIYSLPLISNRLLKPLGIKADYTLIITEQGDGGLRETFLHQGRVRFSRLAPTVEDSVDNYGQLLKDEIFKTRRYLNSLKLLPPGQQLDIYILGHQERVALLQGMLEDESGLHVYPVNLAQVASLTGFSGYPETSFSDALFCYLLQTRLTKNHYAQPMHLRHWQTFKTRIGLQTAAWLLTAACITLSGMQFIDGLLAESETAQLQRITAQVRQDNQRAAGKLPVKPAEAVAMREALRIADQLNAHPPHIERLFSLWGHGFSQQADFTLDELDWFVAADPDEQAPDDVSSQTAKTTGVTLVKETPYLISTVKGHIRNFNGNYRQAHDQVESLLRWLASQPGVAMASVIKQPLNTRTDADLQGSIGKTSRKETADFKLRIVMELKHEQV